MARTYKTLSLSLPPEIVEKLAVIGKPTGRVAARVAAEIVKRETTKVPGPKEETRQKSWCCQTCVVPVQGVFVHPEETDARREWVPVIVLLCRACKKQMHGREYEGWIADA